MTEHCILTPYCKTSFGYGQVRIKGKLYMHHRLVYCTANNTAIEDISDLVVMHTCDNPACINPAHLVLGTKKDNTQDMMRKGRNKYVHRAGTEIGNSKLTTEDVLEIRRSTLRQVDLAAKYGVTQANISSILQRKTWKHI